MDSRLRDQVALVVGASSGIGRAIAAALSAEGVSVMAAARREQQLQELQTELATGGLRCSYAVADVTNPQDMQTLVDKTAAEFGQIDLMVYATGTNTPDRSLQRLTPPLWDEMLQVNLSGAYYITSCVLPLMRQAGAGQLIYISSIGGLAPDGSGAAYQASKRGLLGLAHAIRFEEKKNGIRTCVICPGMVENSAPRQTSREAVRRGTYSCLAASGCGRHGGCGSQTSAPRHGAGNADSAGRPLSRQ